MNPPARSRLYIRAASTKVWHEAIQSNAETVETACGREFRSASGSTPFESLYDKKTTWPPHRAPRCRPCEKKALKGRTG
jgi:hypothetical protein